MHVEAIGSAPGAAIPLPFGNDGPEVEVTCCAYNIALTTTPMLRGLPALVHLPAGSAGPTLRTLLGVLEAETASAPPGATLVRSRLVDLVFVYALRQWLAETRKNCWVGAAVDSSIGPVLEAVHADPGREWTLPALAGLAGQSRAVFCKRFREAVGEPPMAYVARLRMAEAARRLVEGARIADVAAAVGYSNEFAFAKAFKRVRGIAPGAARAMQ